MFSPGPKRAWTVVALGVREFRRIDGAQWAAAFAYRAFFALFPLVLLIVTIASTFIDRDRAGTVVVGYIERYMPMSTEMRQGVFESVAGVIKARAGAGIVAFILLVWFTMRCFGTLLRAGARAFEGERSAWWRVQLKSMLLLGITIVSVFGGILIPMLQSWFLADALHPWLQILSSFGLAFSLVFLGLTAFYRMIPNRTLGFSQVWRGALSATVLLVAAQVLFVVYLKNFAELNAVYGALGTVMALLLWIYFSGCIFILGACFCAAQAQGFKKKKRL